MSACRDTGKEAALAAYVASAGGLFCDAGIQEVFAEGDENARTCSAAEYLTQRFRKARADLRRRRVDSAPFTEEDLGLIVRALQLPTLLTYETRKGGCTVRQELETAECRQVVALQNAAAEFFGEAARIARSVESSNASDFSFAFSAITTHCLEGCVTFPGCPEKIANRIGRILFEGLETLKGDVLLTSREGSENVAGETVECRGRDDGVSRDTPSKHTGHSDETYGTLDRESRDTPAKHTRHLKVSGRLLQNFIKKVDFEAQTIFFRGPEPISGRREMKFSKTPQNRLWKLLVRLLTQEQDDGWVTLGATECHWHGNFRRTAPSDPKRKIVDITQNPVILGYHVFADKPPGQTGSTRIRLQADYKRGEYETARQRYESWRSLIQQGAAPA